MLSRREVRALRWPPWQWWVCLAIGLLPLWAVVAFAVLWKIAAYDPQHRGMAEIHVVNESGEEFEVSSLETGSHPLFWNPWPSYDHRGWISDAPTTVPMPIERKAWTRTRLLDPGLHVLRLSLRLDPDDAPVTVSTSYTVPRDTFCVIVVRLGRRTVDVSACQPRATMIDGLPDL